MNFLDTFKKEVTKKYKELTNEEIQVLYDNKEYHKVIEALIPLAIKMAGHHWNNEDFEDFNSEIMFQLCESVYNTERYKKLRYDNIVAFVYMDLKFKIMTINNYWSSSLIKLPSKQGQKAKKVNDYPTLTLGGYDNVSQPIDTNEKRTKEFDDISEIVDEFHKVLPKYTRFNIQIYIEHFCFSKTYAQIGEEYGISKKGISKRLQNLSAKIRKDEVIKNKLAQILMK